MQRTKGAGGERELCKLLQDELGHVVKRRLGQARDSGCDIPVPGYDIEVKRGERFQSKWFVEAVERAEPGRIPVVAWRRNGEQWRFYPVLDVGEFCEMVRKGL